MQKRRRKKNSLGDILHWFILKHFTYYTNFSFYLWHLSPICPHPHRNVISSPDNTIFSLWNVSRSFAKTLHKILFFAMFIRTDNIPPPYPEFYLLNATLLFTLHNVSFGVEWFPTNYHIPIDLNPLSLAFLSIKQQSWLLHLGPYLDIRLLAATNCWASDLHI